MTTFTYQARDASGSAVEGQIEAADEGAATLALGTRDLTVVSIQSGATRKARKKQAAGRVKIQDLVAFTRQLATMMDAGLPLVQALTSLEEQTTSKPFKAVLKQVTEQVEQGLSFSEALAQHPRCLMKFMSTSSRPVRRVDCSRKFWSGWQPSRSRRRA